MNLGVSGSALLGWMVSFACSEGVEGFGVRGCGIWEKKSRFGVGRDQGWWLVVEVGREWGGGGFTIGGGVRTAELVRGFWEVG